MRGDGGASMARTGIILTLSIGGGRWVSEMFCRVEVVVVVVIGD